MAAVSDVVRRNRLRWFGHVEQRGEEDWVRRYSKIEVPGVRRKGRPKKTWGELLKKTYQRMFGS